MTAKNPPPQDRFVRVEQLLVEFDIRSRCTIYRWARDYGFPLERLCGRTGAFRSRVDAWVEQNRRPAVSSSKAA